MGTKVIAIYSGYHWLDAACDHVVTPSDFNLQEARVEWIQEARPLTPFSEWLVANKEVRVATEADIETIDE